MLIESVARRYARALFEASLAQKVLDTVKHELLEIVHTLKQEPRLVHLWAARLPAEAKKDLIKKMFPGLSALVQHFLFVLVDKRREKLLEKCLEEYEKFLLQFYNQAFVEVRVVSAMPDPVAQELKQRLSQKLGKRVELVVVEDRTLLGGMVIQIGDTVVDGSLRTRLEDLREELLSSPLPVR